MSKAILIMTLSGEIGGAQNRYLNLYNYVCTKKNDYYLIINRSLFDSYDEKDFFVNKEKIIIIDIGKKKKATQEKGCDNNTDFIKNQVKKTKARKIAGKIYYKLFLLINWIIFLNNMNTIIKKNKIKYIYAIWQGGIWGWVLKKTNRLKFAYGYMDASYASLSSKRTKFLEQEYWVLKNADLVDCLSPNIFEDLNSKIGFNKKQKISITPNSFINYKKFFPNPHKENTIVFLSRMVSQKNPILFLKSIEQIQNTLIKYNYKVLLIGKGPMVNEIIKFIKDKELMNVTYVNETFTPQAILSKSKIFVSLQDDDNYPSQSLLEAMACENIVIATNVGNTNMLIDETTGFLVQKEIQDIADTLINVICSGDKFEFLAKNSRQRVLTDHTIEKFYSYFSSLAYR